MADRSVKVTLSAQVQGYIEGMEQAARATRATGSETEKLSQQTEAFEKMGRYAMVAGGAMATGLALSAKAAIDWDTAWAGVTKTVEGSPQQLAAVEDGLRGLTSVLPASHTEIAAVAEAAGQLGIETPNVVAFTRTMIDLGETTNLSSDQAATALARFMNVMGTSQDQVSNLGSALVDLGNNYATTEAEILEMAQRLSGAGAQIGMSEGQVLGLSTALSSVGIEAEAGGSAMSKVMIDIASSVDKGGERLEQFAQVAGMSADSFAEKWKTDPGEALAAFVRGLANAEAQGKSTFGILEELGITEVRMRDALLRSAQASDIFSAAMQQGNEAYAENNALANEAQQRYDTTAAKLGVMRNQVVDAAISLGQHLLPAIETVAEGVGGFADMLGGLDGPMGKFVAFGGLAAAGVLLLGGTALAAVPKIAAFKVALEVLGVTGDGMRSRLRGVGTFLTGPWGVAMLAGGLAVHGLNRAMDESKVTAEEMEIALKQGKNGYEAMREEAGKGLNVAGIYDMTSSVSNLGEVLQESAGYANGFTRFMFQNFDDRAAIDNINELGRSLETLATTDLSAATEQFKSFGEAAGLNRQELGLALDEMPGFKSALLDQAEAAGIATDDATLLAFALGEIAPAAGAGAEGTEAQVASLEELQGVASETSESVSELADQIRNFGSEQFDVERSSIAFQEALAGLEEQMNSGSASLDITTEAGRETQSAMLDVASAANENAAAIAAMGGGTEAIQPILEAGRQKIIESRMALGDGEQAAKQYADQLIATPESVQTQVELLNVEAAKAKVEDYKNTLASIIRNVTTTVDAVVNATKENADGGLYEYADGGIQAYASGGVANGIYSGGTPIYKFAEPETQWEAFISGKPDQRDRNRQLWQQTGRLLGMDGAAGGAQNVTVYVQNPFTGTYLLGQVDAVANSAIDGFVKQQSAANRRAR